MSERPFVSFAEVKQKVSVPDVLVVFGILDRFRRRGDVLTGVCPLPGHKHGPSPNPEQWRADCRKGVWQWYCFGDCQRGGDVVELAKALTGYDNAHVRFWFAERFGDRLSGNRDGPKKTKPEGAGAGERVESDAACEPPPRAEGPQAASATKRNLPVASAELKPLRFRLNLDPDVPYLRDRGVLPETTARYGLGLCRKGVLKGRAAVVEGWKSFFEGEQAPFSWEPETVEVLESGTLALSSGPGRDPEGKQIGTFNSIWRREGGRWRVVFDKGCPVCEAK